MARSQINHRLCDHAQTPGARRACRRARGCIDPAAMPTSVSMSADEARQVPVGTVYQPFPGCFLIVDQRFDDGMDRVGTCATCGHGVVAGKAARRVTDNAVTHTYDCRNAF